jgi:hypothetical protein
VGLEEFSISPDLRLQLNVIHEYLHALRWTVARAQGKKWDMFYAAEADSQDVALNNKLIISDTAAFQVYQRLYGNIPSVTGKSYDVTGRVLAIPGDSFGPTYGQVRAYINSALTYYGAKPW